jgi:hypothetical protein
VSIRIYLEGGGPSKRRNTAIKCRQAFHLFFGQIIPERRFHPVACGGRKETFDDFKHALVDPKHQNDTIILLVDSEMNVAAGMTAKEHLRNRDGWIFPASVPEEKVHMMVQCMEAWFMADKEVLANYYGHGFTVSSLPGNPNIEAINKKDIFDSIQHASRNTRKQKYDKGRDGFEILGLISADRVCQASQHARHLREYLLRALAWVL